MNTLSQPKETPWRTRNSERRSADDRPSRSLPHVRRAPVGDPHIVPTCGFRPAKAPHHDAIARVMPGSRPSGNRSGRLLFLLRKKQFPIGELGKRNGLQNRIQGVRLLPPVLDAAYSA